MSNWKYTDENGEKVMITGGQLKWLAKNGKITPETIIETEEGKSAPARKVKGLTFGSGTTTEITFESTLQPMKPEANPFTAPYPSVAQVQPSATSFCSYCGKGILEHAAVCTSCGMTPLGHKRFCRHCGTALNAEQIICIKCGVSIDGKKLSAPKKVNAKSVNVSQPAKAVPVANAGGEEYEYDANDLGIGFWDVVLKKYCMFSGRARRKEYWWFVFVNFLLILFLCGIAGFVAGLSASGNVELGAQRGAIAGQAVQIVLNLVLLLPGISLLVRRLHDIGKSGWWLFLALIPLIGPVIMFIFTCLDSQPGENRYGANPKGIEE